MDNIVSAAVYVFAKNENNEWCILCGKRSGKDPRHQGGLFDVPVGMREGNESISNTARREALEETGINLPTSNLKFVERQPWGNGKIGSNFLCILDKCVSIGTGDWEHEGFMWLPVNKVDSLQWAYGMNEIVKRFFAQYIQQKEEKEMEISEPELHNMIKESVIRILRDTNFPII